MTALIAYFILQASFLTASPSSTTSTQTTTTTTAKPCAIGWDDND